MGSLVPESVPDVVTDPRSGRLHHVEIWVRDLAASRETLGWLFQELGYTAGESWPQGTSYVGAHDYIVIESGPDVLAGAHRRRAPGMNHLAFVAGSRTRVDELTAAAVDRGFTLLFTDAHPHAGGPDHYASYLEDDAGFEIEMVADDAGHSDEGAPSASV
ncbi:VOC family protein [Paeniglutamicibacter sp. ABSL32-1]|uniref:VOC family protein n=1 Tax=Paeniglutamicibacter quisquiliarum TaxID=2849498 RepID=UPI001C2CDAB4|nr:VOC family protein [Paeniglutamicibacter quisquiliarum]MBV1778619.1 VOC family protein [Paeniglutamicibacter quisquiliarum]